MAAILNFRKTLKKSDAHLYIVGNVMVKFEEFTTLSFFDPKKKIIIHGGHFEFQQNLKKITCTSPYCGECGSKILIISDVKFQSFCAHKKNWCLLLAAILNFGSIFKKSLAHPHVARNVMLKFKKIDQTNFLSFCAHQKIEVDPWRPF